MLNRLTAVIAIGAAALIPLSVTPTAVAQKAANPVLNQGDWIRTTTDDPGLFLNCTIGYVDPEAGHIHTAAHCVDEGEPVYDSGYRPIGEAVESLNKYMYDVAIIKVHEGIELGENIYSGDVVVDSSDLVIGEEMCMYGARTGEIKCDEITSIGSAYKHGVVRAGSGITPVQGDSGGPAWVPGKGFVGVGSLLYTDHLTGEGTGGEWVQSHDIATELGATLPMYQGDSSRNYTQPSPLSSMSSRLPI